MTSEDVEKAKADRAGREQVKEKRKRTTWPNAQEHGSRGRSIGAKGQISVDD